MRTAYRLCLAPLAWLGLLSQTPAIAAEPLPTPAVQASTPEPLPVVGWSDISAELEPDEQAKLASLRGLLDTRESNAALTLAYDLPIGARGQIFAKLFAVPPAKQKSFFKLLATFTPEQIETVGSRAMDPWAGALDWLVELSSRQPAPRIRALLFEEEDPVPPPTSAEQDDVDIHWKPIVPVTNAMIAEQVEAPWQVELYKSGASASPLSALEIRRERDNYGEPLADFERWHECGGVLIGQDWVLTAAHCIKTPRLGPFLDNRRVRTGTGSLVYGGTTWRILGVVKHGRYDPVTKVNDIALLKIAADPLTKVDDNRAARFARLPSAGDPPMKPGEPLSVTGWGVTEVSAPNSRFRGLSGKPKRASAQLMIGRLNNQALQTCNDNPLFKEAGSTVSKGQICALGKGQVDACQGDSGGPLVRIVKGKPTVVGLVSNGIGCGLPDTPGVYVDLTEYLRWIGDAKRAMKPGLIGDWPPTAAAR